MSENISAPGIAQFLPIRTNRLIIRPFRLDDGDALYQLHRNPHVTRHAGGIKSEAESKTALNRLIDKVEQTGFGAFALEELASGEVIGWCGIQQMKQEPGYEIIYALRREKWNKGIVFEAAHALTSLAFREESLKIERLYGIVFPQNIASIRVLEKLGMSFVRDFYDSSSGRHACIYSVHKSAFNYTHSSSK